MLDLTRRLMAVLVAVSCLCSLPAAQAEDAVSLPADDAPHFNSQIEWWYYTAHLFAADGQRYGMQLVFYLFPVGQQSNGQPIWGSASTFAITDLNGAEPRFANESYSQASGFSATRSSFDLSLTATANDGSARRFSAQGHSGQDRLTANLAGYAIDLDVHAQKPAALHGDGGTVTFPGGSDSYYSRTRSDVRGTLSVSGRPVDVSGVAWFDHQYGVQPYVDWSWFSIQLDSREELMVYRWHAPGTDPSQTVTLGTFVPRGGKPHHLSDAQIALTQEASWTSSVTALTYGREWHISVPSEQLELRVTTRYPGSEILPAGQAPYIEADSDVTGTHAGQATHGYAFAEQVFMPTQAP